MTPYVLIVEDDEAISMLLRYNLEKEGYEIGVAMDGEEALLMTSERLPDLVILEMMAWEQ